LGSRRWAENIFFKNAIEVKEYEDGVMPLRFTQKQLDVYAQKDIFRIRSQLPAGMYLDFYTDSSFVEMEFFIENNIRNWMTVDIHVDGCFVDSWRTTLDHHKQHERMICNFPLGHGGLRRVSIFLSQYVQLKIVDIRFSEGAIVESVPRHVKNLLCLGDSITQGVEAIHPSSSYPVLLSQYLDMNLLNQGVGGYYFNADSLDEQLPYKPDLITVAYGTNDWGLSESLAEFHDKCAGFFAKLHDIYPSVPKFVITPLWRSDVNTNRKAGTLFDIIHTIRDIAGATPNVTLINGMELVPHLGEFFGPHEVTKLHPNDDGFARMAMQLAKRIMAPLT
jgi:lysophospholipase L1-like esterase